MYVDPSELTGNPIDTRGPIKQYSIVMNFEEDAVGDGGLGLESSQKTREVRYPGIRSPRIKSSYDCRSRISSALPS